MDHKRDQSAVKIDRVLIPPYPQHCIQRIPHPTKQRNQSPTTLPNERVEGPECGALACREERKPHATAVLPGSPFSVVEKQERLTPFGTNPDATGQLRPSSRTDPENPHRPRLEPPGDEQDRNFTRGRSQETGVSPPPSATPFQQLT